MGSVGDAYDNAMCESFFSTLECELLARRRFISQAEAKIACFSYIEGFTIPYGCTPRLDTNHPSLTNRSIPKGNCGNVIIQAHKPSTKAGQSHLFRKQSR
jgi:hypothetical protein